jgi:spoIIIJ-associated protein
MTENRAEAVQEFCEKLVKSLNFDLAVESSFVDGTVHINLSGGDRPLLLSNTASILNSLEYLVNKVFHANRNEEVPSIILDSDNYRQHREAELVLLAQMASKKVLSQGKPLNLQPMTPKERRIVHLALAQIEGVRSQSEGAGEHRSITIHPAAD